jgi:hypothetical protein
MTTQTTGRRRGLAAALAAASCLPLSGCIPQGLAFRVDDRLSITTPKDRAEVTLPLTVSWRMRDFTITKGDSTGVTTKAGYFAVFVDRAPQPAGKPLSWLARKDRTCRAADGCPGEEYFAARGIYSTTATHLTFDQLPRSSNTHQKERHSVTVVLLDPSGRRIGETAAQVDVVVRRNGLS